MPNCPACGFEVASNKRFCAKCGSAVTPTSDLSGTSLHVDPDTINVVLKAFVSKAGGPSITFDGGRFIVEVGPATLSVDSVQIGPDGLDVKVSVLKLS